jgi:2-polyprenyl-3-methyl-5-hydroxy-6-metoxy-1,4-benzoquinol methylase
MLSRRRPIIVRLLPLIDDADILERNLRWYAEAGIGTIAFGNACGRATEEIARRAVEAGSIVSYSRSDGRLEWAQVSQELLEAAGRLAPELVIVAGADEFLEAEGMSLREAVEQELKEGRDVLQADTMEFCLTDDDDSRQADTVARMRRYSPYRAALRTRAIRWRCGLNWPEPQILSPATAHPSVSSRRLINRHYPLRSPQQALARAQEGRLSPFLAGSSAAALASLVRDERDLVLPARKLSLHYEGAPWTDTQVLAELRLGTVSKLARRAGGARTKLERQVADLSRKRGDLKERHRALHGQFQEQKRELGELKRRYVAVLLDRDRLAAGAGGHDEARLAAPASWYDEQYHLVREKYDAHYSESIYLPVWREIASRIHPEDRVLEVGCGTGQLARLLLDEGLRDYCGFDFSPFAVRLAQDRLPEADVRVDDLRTTTLLDERRYDLVLCTEVLEHLDDDVLFLHQVPPGVRVLATVPNFDATSHLRYFATDEEVVARYGEALAIRDVKCIPVRGTSSLFLLDGARA